MDLDRLVEKYCVGLLVCLLEDEELPLLGIPDLIREAELRMRVIRFPIKDVGIPFDIEALRILLRDIETAAKSEINVAIHCRGGLGRAGTVGGCYLRHRGFEGEAVFSRLRTRHPTQCPETDEQRLFIRSFQAAYMISTTDAIT